MLTPAAHVNLDSVALLQLDDKLPMEMLETVRWTTISPEIFELPSHRTYPTQSCIPARSCLSHLQSVQSYACCHVRRIGFEGQSGRSSCKSRHVLSYPSDMIGTVPATAPLARCLLLPLQPAAVYNI